MNIFHHYTRACLKLNKTRTLVTIIGIILSMAMVTAVIEAAWSGIGFLRQATADSSGEWHVLFRDLSQQQTEELSAQPETEKQLLLSQVGWAEIGSSNAGKPYLLIYSGNDFSALASMTGLTLSSGRYPENSSEILLPNHLSYNGEVSTAFGDTLTLSVGQRSADGYMLSLDSPFSPENAETLTDLSDHTFTVVGYYERFSYDIEPYSCPGYMALTAGDVDSSAPALLFQTVKHPSRIYPYLYGQTISESWVDHTDLLRTYGSFTNDRLTRTFYGFAAILILLIAFGSVSLIYNSFSISVTQRTRQFGILRSIGASRKQIGQCVLYEALLLAGIGILIGALAGCLGLSITFRLLQEPFRKLLGASAKTSIRLIVTPVGLLIAGIITLITTLISAWRPAKRAMDIPAMEAIRQTHDVRLSANEVRTSPLIGKLFGFPGTMAAKNFRRSKKAYRSTILSLFLSVTLFITASSFCSYVKRSIEGMTSLKSNPDLTYSEYSLTPEEACDHLELYREANAVTDAFFVRQAVAALNPEPSRVDDSFLEILSLENHLASSWDTSAEGDGSPEGDGSDIRDGSSGDSSSEDPIQVYTEIDFLDPEHFEQLCREAGLDPSLYIDPSAPKGILFNHGIKSFFIDNGMQYHEYQLLREDEIPINLSERIFQEIDGMMTFEDIVIMDGKEYVPYYSNDYVEALWSSDSMAEPDPDQAELYPIEEVCSEITYPVESTIHSLSLPISQEYPMIFYPITAEAYLGKEGYCTDFCFSTSSHEASYASLSTMIRAQGLSTDLLYDNAADHETTRMIAVVINVFSYGFIVLISLIAAANVFNTISTGITLRRREFAMLRSVGLSSRDFRKMMNCECLIYGFKGLLYSLPVSLLLTWIIYRITGFSFEMNFYIPWYSFVIAIGSVFVVVFTTMLYATSRLKKDNPIDALKSENL